MTQKDPLEYSLFRHIAGSNNKAKRQHNNDISNMIITKPKGSQQRSIGIGTSSYDETQDYDEKTKQFKKTKEFGIQCELDYLMSLVENDAEFAASKSARDGEDLFDENNNNSTSLARTHGRRLKSNAAGEDDEANSSITSSPSNFLSRMNKGAETASRTGLGGGRKRADAFVAHQIMSAVHQSRAELAEKAAMKKREELELMHKQLLKDQEALQNGLLGAEKELKDRVEDLERKLFDRDSTLMTLKKRTDGERRATTERATLLEKKLSEKASELTRVVNENVNLTSMQKQLQQQIAILELKLKRANDQTARNNNGGPSENSTSSLQREGSLASNFGSLSRRGSNVFLTTTTATNNNIGGSFRSSSATGSAGNKSSGTEDSPPSTSGGSHGKRAPKAVSNSSSIRPYKPASKGGASFVGLGSQFVNSSDSSSNNASMRRKSQTGDAYKRRSSFGGGVQNSSSGTFGVFGGSGSPQGLEDSLFGGQLENIPFLDDDEDEIFAESSAKALSGVFDGKSPSKKKPSAKQQNNKPLPSFMQNLQRNTNTTSAASSPGASTTSTAKPQQNGSSSTATSTKFPTGNSDNKDQSRRRVSFIPTTPEKPVTAVSPNNSNNAAASLLSSPPTTSIAPDNQQSSSSPTLTNATTSTAVTLGKGIVERKVVAAAVECQTELSLLSADGDDVLLLKLKEVAKTSQPEQQQQQQQQQPNPTIKTTNSSTSVKSSSTQTVESELEKNNINAAVAKKPSSTTPPPPKIEKRDAETDTTTDDVIILEAQQELISSSFQRQQDELLSKMAKATPTPSIGSNVTVHLTRYVGTDSVINAAFLSSLSEQKRTLTLAERVLKALNVQVEHMGNSLQSQQQQARPSSASINRVKNSNASEAATTNTTNESENNAAEQAQQQQNNNANKINSAFAASLSLKDLSAAMKYEREAHQKEVETVKRNFISREKSLLNMLQLASQGYDIRQMFSEFQVEFPGVLETLQQQQQNQNQSKGFELSYVPRAAGGVFSSNIGGAAAGSSSTQHQQYNPNILRSSLGPSPPTFVVPSLLVSGKNPNNNNKRPNSARTFSTSSSLNQQQNNIAARPQSARNFQSQNESSSPRLMIRDPLTGGIRFVQE